MSAGTAELRFLNNLSVLIALGRPIVDSLRNLRQDSRDPTLREAYDAMIAAAERGDDFTSVLADFPQLCSRSSLALLTASRRASCLSVVLPKLARLVRAKVDGELDPRQRFFETWALLVESGFSSDEALAELAADFHHGPLGEVAEGLRSATRGGKKLVAAAERFPEIFDATSRDLLQYGEARDLPNALRAITRLL
jgi:type II secretory pathway component PulF